MDRRTWGSWVVVRCLSCVPSSSQSLSGEWMPASPYVIQQVTHLHWSTAVSQLTLCDPTGNSSALIHCCQVSSAQFQFPAILLSGYNVGQLWTEFACGLQVVMRGICRWTMRCPSAVCEQSSCSFPWASYLYTCLCHHAVYRLIPVTGHWCPVAGKVTTGLSSHWPCVTNLSGLFTYGLTA